MRVHVFVIAIIVAIINAFNAPTSIFYHAIILFYCPPLPPPLSPPPQTYLSTVWVQFAFTHAIKYSHTHTHSHKRVAQNVSQTCMRGQQQQCPGLSLCWVRVFVCFVLWSVVQLSWWGPLSISLPIYKESLNINGALKGGAKVRLTVDDCWSMTLAIELLGVGFKGWQLNYVFIYYAFMLINLLCRVI